MINNCERGSEWRKWDLHVHTPESDGYKGEWEQFKVQLIKSDCAVIGINDYCSVEGYKRIKNEIDNETLNLIDKKLFPIVELRMTDSVQNKNTTTNGVTHFNFHIIFDDSLNVEDIENFIKSLKCNGTTIGSDYSDKTKLITKKVSFFETLRELNSDHKFKNKYLVWLPYDEYGGIDEIDPKSDGWIKQNFINSSHILGSSNEKQIDFFHWKKAKFTKNQYKEWFGVKKPCIKGSDSHNHDYTIGKLKNHKSEPIEKYCWIKADPTFEGLKQIICEPEDRVLIQSSKPEEKSGYQVIDSIEIDSDILNQKLKFNPNLNTIIGGRSTGKSTLLKLIAYKIDQTTKVSEEFIKDLSTEVNIKWQDEEENISRDIEYFHQGYMHEIASRDEKKNTLIEKIIKTKEISSELEKYEVFCSENQKDIQSDVDKLFEIRSHILEVNESLKQLGDLKGIEKEIQTINFKIKQSNTDNFTAEQLAEFEQLMKSIRSNEQKILILYRDKKELEILKNKPLFDQSFVYLLNSLSEDISKQLSSTLKRISKIAHDSWNLELTQTLEKLKEEVLGIQSDNQTIKEKTLFKQGLEQLGKNKQYKELTQKLDTETKKKDKITSLQKQVEKLEDQESVLLEAIIVNHNNFSEKINGLIKSFSVKHQNIEINIKSVFQKENCKNTLSDFVNLQGSSRQSYVDDWVDTYQSNIKEKSRSLLKKALNNKIRLKAYKNADDFAKQMLAKNWFKISYQLTYENDTFNTMSDGKKAFVVLNLLLEFSNKKCPILIDQPEDSLDNRAIYNELVQYIKKKKKERQIILVTHNANVVVNADAEEVIVANQHGQDSKNTNNIKFEYVSGSLENTFPHNKLIPTILHSQGIREHVCEILEGGTEAFKKREYKYDIK